MKKENLYYRLTGLFSIFVLSFMGILNLNGQTKTYSDTTYYYNKNIKSINTVNGDFKTETTYYENGYIKSTSNYYKNSLDKQQLRWYENGKQQSLSNYKNSLIDHKTEWYSNGLLKNIENYIYLKIENQSLKQLYHGEYLQYMDNGNIKIKGQYDSGLMVNQWETYFENGQKNTITNYAKGYKNGTEIIWYSNGSKQSEANYLSIPRTNIDNNYRTNSLDNGGIDNVKRKGPNGNYYNTYPTINYITVYHKKRITYYENGQKNLEYNYNNGLREGTCKEWHNNGKLKSLREYKDNNLNGKNYSYFYNGKPQQIITQLYSINKYQEKYDGKYEMYYNDGTPQTIGNYKNGKLNGLYTTYYENGNKKRETSYIYGLKTGEEKHWHATGKINTIHHYKYFKINDSAISQLDGLVISYNSNGNMTQKSFYKSDKLNGLQEEWHTNGKKKSEVEYCNGMHCGIEKYWDEKGYTTSEKKYILNKENGNKNMLVYNKEFKDSVLTAYYQYNTNGNLYKVNKYNASGLLKSTTQVLTSYNDSYSQSYINRIIKYFDNGNIESDEFSVNENDNIQGISFYYYIDGSPRLYKYNALGEDSINVFINWTPSGQLLSHQNRMSNYPYLATNLNDKKTETEVYQLMLDYQKNKPNIKDFTLSETWENSNKLIEIKKLSDSTLDYNAYYLNGNPFFSIQYKEHIPHGNYIIWAYNGIKLEEGQYYNGKKINHWVFKNIKNIKEKEITFTLKDESSGLYKGYFANGLLNEEYTFEKFNRNGKRTTYYNENGNLYTEEYYKSGRLDSAKKTFNINGNLITYEEYKNGSLNGVTKQWADNGTLIIEMHYKKNIKDSTYKKWWENGKPMVNGYYKYDTKDSIWSFYNESGKLIVKEQYKRNETYPTATYNASSQCHCINSQLAMNKETPNWQKANEYNKLKDIKCLETLYNYQNQQKVYFSNYQTKKEKDETISTFNLQLKDASNLRRWGNSQLVFNPCFSFENKAIEIPCTTQITDNGANITMKTNKLAIYFNNSLLKEIETSNLKKYINELSNQNSVSKLLFSASSITANNKKTTLNNIENLCFTPSYIGYSKIQLKLDSAKISMNSEFSTQIKSKFNYNSRVINDFNSYLFNHLSSGYRYNESGSIEVLSNHGTYIIPNKLFDTAYKDTSVFTRGNILIQDNYLFGSIVLKAQNTSDNIYSIMLENKSTTIDIKQLEETFENYGFRNFTTHFDTAKNELSLFFKYIANN